MMFFDIAHFKQVSDSFGHAIGGDELVILLPQASARNALPVAKYIHASISETHLNPNKGPLRIKNRIGIAQLIHNSSDPDTVESLLLQPDQALYATRKPGSTARSYLV